MRAGSKVKRSNFFGSFEKEEKSKIDLHDTTEKRVANPSTPFFRQGDDDDVQQRWVEDREEMTDDYKKRHKAAKRRRQIRGGAFQHL